MSSKAKRVFFVDMDGVLCDFISAALKVHGIPHDTVEQHWEDATNDVYQTLGLSKAEFWNPIAARGVEFWANLEPLPYFKDLLSMLEVSGREWYVLTSPTHHHSCHAGKVQWLQKHLGSQFRNYIMTPANNKKFLAHVPGALLIDDYPKNVNQFQEAGGQALLYPPQWDKAELDMLWGSNGPFTTSLFDWLKG